MEFERPFYGIIVDGIHCHPNSVRVCTFRQVRNVSPLTSRQLAYSSHPEKCILVTDGKHILSILPNRRCSIGRLAAQKILDPNLKDGVYEWRDGQRYVKEGDRLYLEGTDTLAGTWDSKFLIITSVCY
jgi:N-acetylglucosamine-6-phosphate deacetylase